MTETAEQISRRLEDSLDEQVRGLDKSHIRKIQRAMHLCAAKCCEKDNLDMDSVQRCMDGCSKPLANFQSAVEQEIGKYQARVQRCAKDCQDNATDKLGNVSGASVSTAQVEELKPGLSKCFSKCADDHIKLLPGIFKRLSAVADTALKSMPKS